MTAKKLNEFNVDEIMEKIRAEVELRKSGGSNSSQPFGAIPTVNDPAFISTGSQETKTWRLVKKIQNTLKDYAVYNYLYRVAVKFKKFIPKYRSSFTLNEFLNYRDDEFIKNAYKIILKRAPDDEGYTKYLSRLRNADLHKVEIIGRMKYSPEGREKGVKIRGLLIRFLYYSAIHIPVIGYPFMMVLSILRLPVILRNAQKYEAFTDSRFTKNAAAMQELSSGTEAKFVEQSSSLTTNISSKITETASLLRGELAESASHISGELAHATSLIVGELRQTAGHLAANLSGKADQQQILDIRNELSSLLVQIRDNKMNMVDQQRRLAIFLEEMQKKLPAAASSEQIKSVLAEGDHLLDAMYVVFEDHFRGTREDIRERLTVYLPYIEKVKAGKAAAAILDIGCGRGEWLELLQQNGFAAAGIDLNRVMVRQCKENGFNAIESDAIEYLKTQQTDSLSAITGFHLIEHLPFKMVIALLDEAYRVLRPGGLIILETPNPENLQVGSCNFYMDPSHRNPIPPEPLNFIAQQRGFVKTEILRLHKVKDVPATEQKFVDEIVRRFNMEQDYSLIGYKA